MKLGVVADVRALPRRVWVLYAGTFINRFGSFVFTFLILYLKNEGYSTSQAGLAVSAYGIGALAASGIGGFLADRFGRRNTIALSMFSGAATMMALSQARRLPLIVICVALAGFTSELYRPATGALLADIVPPEQRVTAFAAFRLAINLGFAAGPVAAGFLAGHSFFLLFAGDAITSVIFGFIALAGLPPGTHAPPEPERRGEAVRAIAADKTFLAFLAASICGAFIYFQGTTTLALHVKASGLSIAIYGTLISLNGLIIVFVELPLTGWTKRLPVKPVLMAGLFLTGAGFALTGPAHTFLALAATVSIWTIGEIVYAPVASAYVAGLAPLHLRGRYQGAWTLTWAIGTILGPAVGAAIYARKPEALWALCGLLGVAAAVFTATGRDAAPMPEAAALAESTV